MAVLSPRSTPGWPEAAEALRRHIGAVRHVVRRDHDGVWLAVALIKTADDDVYTVVAARYVGDDKITHIRRMRREGR